MISNCVGRSGDENVVVGPARSPSHETTDSPYCPNDSEVKFSCNMASTGCAGALAPESQPWAVYARSSALVRREGATQGDERGEEGAIKATTSAAGSLAANRRSIDSGFFCRVCER